MPLTTADKEFFASVLPADSIIFSGAGPEFTKHTIPWSLSYDQSPRVALVPETVEQLQAVVKYVCVASHLDFCIRGSGVGNASAEDVVISMRKFDNLDFDKEKEVAYVGAGLNWGQVDDLLSEKAAGYVGKISITPWLNQNHLFVPNHRIVLSTVVGARCPYVGVTGSTLAAGLSWLSHEHGLSSDPRNMLDVHIVLADGRAIWASEEPDLLWALRGGSGNFGAVTTICFKAHRTSPKIFSSMVMYPDDALPALSRGLAKWAHSKAGHDPRTALHIFIFDFTQQSLHGTSSKPQMAAIMFDGNGEEHARGPQGFQWALEIPGVHTIAEGEKGMKGIHELQRSTEATHGTTRGWLQAALVGDEGIWDDDDHGILGRMWKWFEKVKKETPELGLGCFTLLEIMQEPAMNSGGGPQATAWPHGGKGRQHVLQLGVGAGLASGETAEKGGAEQEGLKQQALRVLGEAPSWITSRDHHPSSDFLPNFPLDNHDHSKIFEGNWERLRKFKSKYDPAGRFNKGLFIPPL